MSKSRWWTVATLVVGGLLTVLGGIGQATYQSHLDTRKKDREEVLQRWAEEQKFQRDSLLRLQETAGRIDIASAEVSRANPLHGRPTINFETDAHARSRVQLLDLLQKGDVYSSRVLDDIVRDLYARLRARAADITYPMVRQMSRVITIEIFDALEALNERVGQLLREQFLRANPD